MSPSTLILLPLLFFLLQSTANASSVIEQTCSAINTTRPNIGYNFCVASLESDPSSINSDANRLAIIAANLSVANASRILSKIDSLMEVESSPSRKDCLSVCSEVYSDAIDHLNVAIKNLSSMCYKDAMTFLSAALDASDDCEQAFDDEGDVSPMEAEDRDYARLADIALTIAASLG